MQAATNGHGFMELALENAQTGLIVAIKGWVGRLLDGVFTIGGTLAEQVGRYWRGSVK